MGKKGVMMLTQIAVLPDIEKYKMWEFERSERVGMIHFRRFGGNISI